MSEPRYLTKLFVVHWLTKRFGIVFDGWRIRFYRKVLYKFAKDDHA